MRISLTSSSKILSITVVALTIGLSWLAFRDISREYEDVATNFAFESQLSGYAAVTREDLMLGSPTTAIQKLGMAFSASKLKAECLRLSSTDGQQIGEFGKCPRTPPPIWRKLETLIPFNQDGEQGYRIALIYNPENPIKASVPAAVKLGVLILTLISAGTLCFVGIALSRIFNFISEALQGKESNEGPWTRFSEIRELIDLIRKNRILSLRNTVLEVESAKSEALTNLARQVAHDIRSPLTALRTLGSNIEALSEAESSLLQMIIKRIDGIAEDLLRQRKNELEISKVTELVEGVTLKVPLHVPATSIQAWSLEIIGEKKLSFPHYDIEWYAELAPGSLKVTAEENKFKRILSNLINNAVEAMPLSGKLRVSAEYSEQAVHLNIRDNGPGISDELIAKVLTGGTTTKLYGNGMGLSDARTSVESWNGRLKLYSAIGRGTTVSITLTA